jgi:TnsA endonuclease N terminal
MKPKQPKTIKNFLKPRAGKVQQGYFKPANPEKYIGDVSQIIFRSSWEFKFLKWCDSSPTILAYASEPIGIPYYSPLDQRGHVYYVDFYIITKDNQGNEQKFLIEVKPDKYTKPPVAPKRMTDKQTASYVYAAKQYIVNKAKFEAAKEFAQVRGLKFGIITENFLFKTI